MAFFYRIDFINKIIAINSINSNISIKFIKIKK